MPSNRPVQHPCLRRVVALALVAATIALSGMPTVAQSSALYAATDTSYLSADVQRSKSVYDGSGFRVRGNTLESINTTLDDLLEFSFETQRQQITNIPPWGDRQSYDISLVFHGDTPPNDLQCKQMIREVLAQRFGLVVHKVQNDVEAYVLTVGPDGAKLAASMGDPTGLPGLRMPSPGFMEVQNASITDFAQVLQRSVMGQPVVDKTGLGGRWDFTLKWQPEDSALSGHPQPASDKPALNTALLQQLGLVLEKRKTSSQALVVDDVSQPKLP